jgi:glycosyltransferase involved in cell wall biosynthesis
VPVVASNFGAMAEAIEDGRTGLLFDAGDSVDLARRIDQLARDRELRQRLAAAPKTVATIEENGARHLALYERVLRARSR